MEEIEIEDFIVVIYAINVSKLFKNSNKFQKIIKIYLFRNLIDC